MLVSQSWELLLQTISVCIFFKISKQFYFCEFSFGELFMCQLFEYSTTLIAQKYMSFLHSYTKFSSCKSSTKVWRHYVAHTWLCFRLESFPLSTCILRNCKANRTFSVVVETKNVEKTLFYRKISSSSGLQFIDHILEVIFIFRHQHVLKKC